MKRTHKIIAAALVCALAAVSLAQAASAVDNYLLSPGLNVLKANYCMAKWGLAGSDIWFDAAEFAAALGVDKADNITITSLPSREAGRLMLGSQEVEVGQTIKEKNLSSLRFVANSSDELETEFTFCLGKSPLAAEYSCTVFALTTPNAAPVVYQPDLIETGVYSGTQYLGTLNAVDPEDDDVVFEIVDEPDNGKVELTDITRGYYIYTPDADFEGRDSFTARARDCYGNYSNTVKVSLDADMPRVDEVFSDMDGHWANAAAITCVREGILTAGGSLNPEQPVSRAEFLSLIMSAAGYDGFYIEDTGFADDSQIRAEYKGCIAAAEALGVITGIDSESGKLFCPNNQITRAEAAVMIARLTGMTGEGTLEVFADESVPAWAQSAMSALNTAGILRGDGDSLDPYGVMTRAAAIQLAAELTQ